MTTFYDVPADLLIPALAGRLEGMKEVNQPDWAEFVKTGAHKERPPVQSNWWFLRSAAIMRKVGRMGPIGVNHLSQAFGGPKNRGSAPNRATAGSRHVIRTSLQQLEDAGLVTVRRLPGRSPTRAERTGPQRRRPLMYHAGPRCLEAASAT